MADIERAKELIAEVEKLQKEKGAAERATGKVVDDKKIKPEERDAEVAKAEGEQRAVEKKVEALLEDLVPLLEQVEELTVPNLEDEEEQAAVRKERDELSKKLEDYRDLLEIYRLKSRFDSVYLLRALKDKAWEALVKFRHVEVCPPNKVFINQGDYTGQFHVLIEGLAGAYRTEPGGEVVRLGALGAGDWFGEMSALANQPAMATVKSEQRCTVLAIDPPLFKILYGQNAFKNKIDAKYRQRALAAHLRAAPVLKGVPEEKILPLQDEAELLVLPEGTTLFKEGDPADAMYLIRTGSVKCTRVHPETGGEQIVAYLMDNSSFGEQALSSTDRTRALTVTTLERTDAVKLSRDLLERVYADDRQTMDTIIATADAILAAESGQHTAIFDILSDEGIAGRLTRDELDVMVARQAVKGGEALVIDLEKCTRCNACVESCVAVHDDRAPRLSKAGTRIAADKVLTTACYNCETPGCMSKCNDGAIRRDIKGSIHFIWDNCTGCTACVMGCPYGVIRMADISQEKAAKSPYGGPGFLEGIPLFGRLLAKLGNKEKEEKGELDPVAAGLVSARTGRQVKDKKAIKCDLCAGLPFEACVYNCPCGAIDRVNPEALFAKNGGSA